MFSSSSSNSHSTSCPSLPPAILPVLLCNYLIFLFPFFFCFARKDEEAGRSLEEANVSTSDRSQLTSNTADFRSPAALSRSVYDLWTSSCTLSFRVCDVMMNWGVMKGGRRRRGRGGGGVGGRGGGERRGNDQTWEGNRMWRNWK